MSFEVLEESVDDAQPIELLLISFLTNRWSYCTASEDIVYDGNLYVPMPISHDEPKSSGDASRASIDVRLPYDCPVGELFRVQPPSGVVSLTLFAIHFGDTEAKALWKGRVTNSEWERPWLVLTSENVFSSLRTPGLGRKFSVGCPLTLYRQGAGQCNVNKDAYKSTHVVSAVNGLTLSCPSASGIPYAYFDGGFATWTNVDTGFVEQRMIVGSDTSGSITLVSTPIGCVPGSPVTIYPGCDHSLATCHSKFSNSLNHGGTPFIPRKNPFGGSTLY